MEIQVRNLCTCENGIISHPFWENHNERVKAYKEKMGEYPSGELEQCWLSDTGRDYKKIPEEIECNKCNGTGYVTSYIDFSDFKQMILEP